MNLRHKKEELKEIIHSRKHWAVACSGGLDSSFLLWFIVAHTEVAVTAFFVDHDLLPEGISDSVRRFVSLLVDRYSDRKSISFDIIKLNFLSEEKIRRNYKDRCYHCKYIMFSNIVEKMKKYQCDALCDGTLESDPVNERPGFLAAGELGVSSPLRIAGFTKNDLIEIAKREIPFEDDLWFRNESCIATRIPFYCELNPELIKRIDMIEQFVKKYISGAVRARFNNFDNSINLEIQSVYFDLFFERVRENELVDLAKKLGFNNLTLKSYEACEG